MAESRAELVSLQQIRCFCATIELGSFSAAAEALRVSQPAVAEQIRKLEHILDTDLFVRGARGVLPTEAGQAFAVHATRSLQGLDDATESVSQFTSLRSGTVALGTFSATSATVWRLEELVAAFLERHPDMSVRLVGRNSSVTADRVRRGELEAAVVLLPIDDERLQVRPIVRDEVVYVTAAPERARRAATIEQLASTPLVFYDAGVRRQRPDSPPARRARPGPRSAAAPAGRGGADRPRSGPRRSEDMLLAAKLALKQAGDTAGKYKIKLVSVDNSTASAGQWDPAATSAAARKAISDDPTIAYLGELNSGASAVSIPILNEAGILQVSAANTAVGLTRKEGGEPGEPDKYPPAGQELVRELRKEKGGSDPDTYALYARCSAPTRSTRTATRR